MKRFASFFAIILSISLTSFSQGTSLPEDSAAKAYTKVITGRAAKIVATLEISDAKKAGRVTDIIADQYRVLNDFHNAKNARIKELKASKTDDAILKKEAAESMDKLAVIHNAYIAKLKTELNDKQLEQVKDGMTYGVLPLTYRSYQEMILTLTPEQKEKIMKNLVEARELAMDAESSDAKHAWFGKYKGRINNLLAADGYDLKKEGDEWQKRIRAAKN